MPRFAILDHDHPFRHWDFLLEAGPVLRAWRLLTEPGQGKPIRAESLPHHRLLYLEYEGPIDGDRGHVVRWDAGSFAWDDEGADDMRVHLIGGRIIGLVTLRRDENGWTWQWT